jgi:hypothetical protein
VVVLSGRAALVEVDGDPVEGVVLDGATFDAVVIDGSQDVPVSLVADGPTRLALALIAHEG